MPDQRPNSHELLLETFEGDSTAIERAERETAREKSAARLRLLWGKRRFLARMAGAGLLLSAVIAFLTPNEYQSTARLMPPDQNGSSGLAMLSAVTSKAGSGLGSLASSFLGMSSTSILFVGILQSRTVQDDLISKFDLRKVYKHKLWEDTRKELASNTGLSNDRQTGIVTIQVTDRDPKRAAAMAQEYVEELNRVVAQLNTSSAHRERVFLEARLAQVHQDLESAEKNFSQFASKNTAIDIKEQSKAMIDAAGTLEGQLIAAQTELEGLKKFYADGNVRVRATQARVNELQRNLQKLRGTSGAAAPSNDSREQLLYPSIRQLPILGVTYADLYRTMTVQEAVFETLTQEYELAKVQEAKETPSVSVLDAPEVPERKSSPHRLTIMVIGMLVFLVGGAFWLLGGAKWEQVSPQDPGKVLAIEILDTMKSNLPSASSESRGGWIARIVKGMGRGKKPPASDQ